MFNADPRYDISLSRPGKKKLIYSQKVHPLEGSFYCPFRPLNWGHNVHFCMVQGYFCRNTYQLITDLFNSYQGSSGILSLFKHHRSQVLCKKQMNRTTSTSLTNTQRPVSLVSALTSVHLTASNRFSLPLKSVILMYCCAHASGF